ncbi:MAG: 30S ribosomal protein S9 [Candidatus Nanoarchaeia archaeon]|nr:30S ribosomal protein S9 [Candidatus Nanoarchaeia archaeon]MDD5741338.1 30S ribosomal protein S9 [Candidatus Nanoarchaeia archaeon]
MEMQKNIVVGGKRKTALAKATIKPGNGRILINKIPYENLDFFKKLTIEEIIELTKQAEGNFDFDIEVKITGGGNEGQISAARLAIARALVEFTKSEKLKKDFLNYDRSLLVADTRRKEAYKPGDSKARRKRQKSFR